MRPQVERLESKRLLATISGQVYLDTLGYGDSQVGGPGLFDWTVFLDSDDNGVLQPGEISTTTNANGGYTFSGLPAGSYRVREVVLPGWVQTTLVPDAITVGANDNVQVPAFGNFQTGQITGSVFDDANGDGTEDAGEAGLPDVPVFLDQNQDAVPDNDSTLISAQDTVQPIPAGATDVTSNLLASSFIGTLASVTVRLNIAFPTVQDLSVTLVTPWGAEIQLVDPGQASGDDFNNTFLDDSATATIESGQTPYSGTYLPAQSLASVAGHSANGDWMLEVTNTGTNTGSINGWAMNFTTTDPVTTTDAYGQYTFTGIPAGMYTVREVLPSGEGADTPNPALATLGSSGTTATANFGNIPLATITGTVFDDTNGDGVLDAGDSPLSGMTVFLDQNGDAVLDTDSTTLSSADVPEVIPDLGTTYSDIPVEQSLGTIDDLTVTLNINHPFDSDLVATLISPDGTQVRLFTRVGSNGQDFVDTVLSDSATTPISSGSAPFTGTYLPQQALATFAGENPAGNWILQVSDVGPLDIGTLISWSITFQTSEPVTSTDANGDYSFTGLLPGTYTVRQAAVTGWGQTTANPVSVTVPPGGGTTAVVNFGDIQPFLTGPTVTPTSSTPELEEEIAVAPSDPNFLVVVAGDYSLNGGSYTTKYAYSTDGGSTWTQSFVPLANGEPATGDGQIWQDNGNPVVAIDNNGNVYMVDMYYDLNDLYTTSNGLYVSVGSVSPQGPQFTAADTFPVAVNLNPVTYTSEDKPWIAVDNSDSATEGNVYVTWTHYVGSTEQIDFSRSVDQGRTWSAPLMLNLPDQNGLVQGSQVAVGPDGQIDVVYATYSPGGNAGGQDQIFVTVSTNGGTTFSTPQAITGVFQDVDYLAQGAQTYRFQSWPAMTVGPDGVIYVAYASQVGASANIELITSSNGGQTFSQPLTLNDVVPGQRGEPAVAVDPTTGLVWVSWVDTRNYLDNSTHYDIYAAVSSNDGQSFSPNVEIDQTSGYAGEVGSIGDYTGIAAEGGFAHVVWTSGGHNTPAHLQTATLEVPVVADIVVAPDDPSDPAGPSGGSAGTGSQSPPSATGTAPQSSPSATGTAPQSSPSATGTTPGDSSSTGSATADSGAAPLEPDSHARRARRHDKSRRQHPESSHPKGDHRSSAPRRTHAFQQLIDRLIGRIRRRPISHTSESTLEP